MGVVRFCGGNKTVCIGLGSVIESGQKMSLVRKVPYVVESVFRIGEQRLVVKSVPLRKLYGITFLYAYDHFRRRTHERGLEDDVLILYFAAQMYAGIPA